MEYPCELDDVILEAHRAGLPPAEIDRMRALQQTRFQGQCELARDLHQLEAAMSP